MEPVILRFRRLLKEGKAVQCVVEAAEAFNLKVVENNDSRTEYASRCRDKKSLGVSIHFKGSDREYVTYTSNKWSYAQCIAKPLYLESDIDYFLDHLAEMDSTKILNRQEYMKRTFEGRNVRLVTRMRTPVSSDFETLSGCKITTFSDAIYLAHDKTCIMMEFSEASSKMIGELLDYYERYSKISSILS